MSKQELLNIKSSVRQSFRLKRQSFLNNNIYKEALSAHLLELIKDYSSPIVASYFPTIEEADPNGVFESLKVYRWAFPKLEGNTLQFLLMPRGLDFYDLSNSEYVEKNEFGIFEPKYENCPKLSHDKITHVFVPGVAFDRKGSRLGMGKGYYDRFLPELKAIKIGIGLSAQIADFDLPVEEHDVALDYIVTEKFIIEPVEKEDL